MKKKIQKIMLGLMSTLLQMKKKGMGRGIIGTLLYGLIVLIIWIQTYNDSIGNFTGLTLLIMGFVAPFMALGLLSKATS